MGVAVTLPYVVSVTPSADVKESFNLHVEGHSVGETRVLFTSVYRCTTVHGPGTGVEVGQWSLTLVGSVGDRPLPVSATANRLCHLLGG